MWSGNDKVWMHYLNNIIAADLPSAVLLSYFLRNTQRGAANTRFHEVADIQRYKMIRSEKKVRLAMTERANQPFVFVLGKN